MENAEKIFQWSNFSVKKSVKILGLLHLQY